MSIKISIITVTYNAENFLETTIKSVLEQTYPNIEYIIIDGQSKDSTVNIIKKYEENIFYWVSQSDKGIYDAMNKGIKKATGEWIIFLNAGDIFSENNTLELFSKHLKEDLSLFYGGVNIIEEYGLRYLSPIDLKDFKIKMPCCHQAVFFKLEVIKKYLFNTNFKINADLDLILTLFKNNYNYKYIDLPVVNFLKDGFHSLDKPRGFIDELYVTSKYLETCKDIYNHQSYKLLKSFEDEKDFSMNTYKDISMIVTQLDDISKNYSKILLYGNSNLSKLIDKYLSNKIIGILDNSANNLNNSKIFHPIQILEIDFDIILITLLSREEEIIIFLKGLGIKEDKIMFFKK